MCSRTLTDFVMQHRQTVCSNNRNRLSSVPSVSILNSSPLPITWDKHKLRTERILDETTTIAHRTLSHNTVFCATNCMVNFAQLPTLWITTHMRLIQSINHTFLSDQTTGIDLSILLPDIHVHCASNRSLMCSSPFSRTTARLVVNSLNPSIEYMTIWNLSNSCGWVEENRRD